MEEERLRNLLTENYDYLVRHISTREVIPHLISKHVFQPSDKEDVESKITSIDRSGRLIDIVTQRGYNGMHEFMQVLEYDVPAAFVHVTKTESRPPPADWLKIRHHMPSVRKHSARQSMSHVTGIISQMMSDIDNQRQAVEDLMQQMGEVKRTQQTTSIEQEKDWSFYESQITELEDSKALMTQDLVKSRLEHEKTKAELKEVNREKERLISQETKDRERLNELQKSCNLAWEEMEAYKSRKSQLNTRESQDVHLLSAEVDRLTRLLHDCKDDEVVRLSGQVTQMAQRNAEFAADFTKSHEQNGKLRTSLKTAESEIDKLKVQNERLQQKNETLEKKSNELMLKIGQLEDKLDNEMYWSYRRGLRSLVVGEEATPHTPLTGAAAVQLAQDFRPYNYRDRLQTE